MRGDVNTKIHPPHVPRFNLKYVAGRVTDANVVPPSDFSTSNPRFRIRESFNRRKVHLNQSPVIPNGPISPQEALEQYGSFLNIHELKEITNFPEIYYLGLPDRKIIPNDNENNYGYDNDTQNFKLVCGDHLAYRYEILSIYGAGAFGQVVRCFDHKNKIPIAVKVLENTDLMRTQGKVEARILARLNKANAKYVVKAFEFFIFRNHICITFEILGKNLYEILESGGFSPLPVKQVKLYSTQILKALYQAHKLGIIHCDLKPENVLLEKDSVTNVKLIDFGSSCLKGHQLYEYIQSRFYRAPEVILGIRYETPMDIWSFALIVVELLTGRALFPGNSEEEMLWRFSELLGFPPLELVKEGKRRREFFDSKGRIRSTKSSPRVPNSLTLQTILNTNDPTLIDFLSKCLVWGPKDRMTAAEALQHPWITSSEILLHKKSFGILPELR